VKRVYALLCVLGFVLPYYFFVPFVLANGLNIRLLISQLLANQISTFFGADVIVASLVLWVFIYQETRKRRIRLWWLSIVGNVAVGVSFGFPLFLWLREIEIGKQK
jgi:predicted MFS family arabinose efflux permease